MISTVATIALVAAGTGVSTLWFLSVLRLARGAQGSVSPRPDPGRSQPDLGGIGLDQVRVGGVRPP